MFVDSVFNDKYNFEFLSGVIIFFCELLIYWIKFLYVDLVVSMIMNRVIKRICFVKNLFICYFINN